MSLHHLHFHSDLSHSNKQWRELFQQINEHFHHFVTSSTLSSFSFHCLSKVSSLSTKIFLDLDSDLITVTIGQRPFPPKDGTISTRIKSIPRLSPLSDRILAGDVIQSFGIDQLPSVVMVCLSTLSPYPTEDE